MLISDFEYDLPEELIAQQPAEKRAESRMLVLNRSDANFRDAYFFELPQILREGDLLVLNNTKVFPARIFGESETGARIELLLIREVGNRTWESLARPARRLKAGKRIAFGEKLSAEVLERTLEGRVLVRFEAKGDVAGILDEIGRMPLPPYIKRKESGLENDRERYQTVFAKHRGAIAAPTAGLHFTSKVLDEIRSRGAEIVEITLHVGYGTFAPVSVDDLSEHSVMPERTEISEEAAESLNRAIAGKRRIIAVGTTTTRTLESAIDEKGRIMPGNRVASLTIRPGYEFNVIGGLLTNFHLPRSSLLVLVSTFGGYRFIMDAYRHAVASRYRFYSYGDCMLIL